MSCNETKKIIIVDDDKEVCLSIIKLLKKRGYQVDMALNAQEALSKMENSSFDLALIDLMIPQTNGMELLKTIKEKKPFIKVIIITGYATIQSAVLAMKCGAENYLAKPFMSEELFNAVNQALGE